jgi:hypothetical protein
MLEPHMKHVVAIVQSSYIPWKGYFDLIGSVDEFILYDDMQFTRRDWRNRNLVKTPTGLSWLTVPVQVKGKYDQSIRDTVIDGPNWAAIHWKTLVQNYKRAPHFERIAALLEPVYCNAARFTHLSDLNRSLLQIICAELGIKTPLRWSWEYPLKEGKTERLVDLCVQTGATEYISGPAAKDYIDKNLFDEAGIKLTFYDYSNYPEYPQLWGSFEHGVTALDLLFNCGDTAPDFMKFKSSSRKNDAPNGQEQT